MYFKIGVHPIVVSLHDHRFIVFGALP